jgi:signal transduction histidine kinase
MHGPLNARYREYGADIATSGTHLLHLINEILDLSKLEAGQFDLHEGEVDLASVIRSCLHLVEAQAGKSKIKLSSSNESGLPLIRADERRMRQILINLLSNAIKFTPEGGCVGITVSCGTSGFFIEVRDTGIGMSADGIAKAMEPFGQIESAISRKHDGTGLGLPIAKRLVELHGGTLTIASKVDAGTAVTIRLPSERIAQRPARLAIVQATA